MTRKGSEGDRGDSQQQFLSQQHQQRSKNRLQNPIDVNPVGARRLNRRSGDGERYPGPGRAEEELGVERQGHEQLDVGFEVFGDFA